jgi:hypothetical protein
MGRRCEQNFTIFEIALVLVRLDHSISASHVTLSSSRKAVLEFSNEMPFWFV